jgi:predicted nucleic acid-binding protein
VLVIDANILIRAVLGTRVPSLLRKYAGQGEFFAPDSAFREAREKLPIILERRAMRVAPGLTTLGALCELVLTVEFETYAPTETLAAPAPRPPREDDWPVLASALVLGYPIWTEDTDFSVCGVATWTTDRVEPYLRDAVS